MLAPKCTVRYHRTLGETGGSAGLIDERHLTQDSHLLIVYVFLTEILQI